MDRLEAMSIFIAAVEAGSFSAAARKLGRPLPTVSRKVAQLEESLGTRLLTRTTRKLTLTEVGSTYFSASKRILEAVRDADRGASGEFLTPRGDLVITAPIVFGRWHVLPIVCDFLAQYPDIKVRLVLSDRNMALVDDQVDIAVRVGALPDSALVATRVGAVRPVVCASPGFIERYGRPRAPAELATLPCVTFELLSGTAQWSFAPPRGGRVYTVSILERLSVNTAEAAMDAAVQGVGLVRVLSYQCAPAVRRGELQLVLRQFEPSALPAHLVHPGGRLLPLKSRTFLDFSAPRLRAALQALPGAKGE